ncbi:hypothetical protein Q9966_012293 [Columba livia]|nr:hypothetical protein Q9966_012293 [Columba livia]
MGTGPSGAGGVRRGRAKPDISLPREKLLRAKEIKTRKKIPREKRQNAEMESAARLRTVSVIDILFVFLIQASSSPAVSSEADKGSLQTVLLTNPGE